MKPYEEFLQEKSIKFRYKQSQEIVKRAIEKWQPKAIVSLFSGGYDSMITTHLLHTMDTYDLPIQVWAIDTQLAADGWHKYVQSVAEQFDWDFQIYNNQKGFQQFVNLVIHCGCPKSRKMHTYAFQKLKERGIDAIHMLNKEKRSDKTLFISGIRRSESIFRKSAAEVARIGKSNKIFAAPIVYWENEDCNLYRIANNLPDNPFYNTVKGSGDCQCNWGDFIDLKTLRKYSPRLASNNVNLINKLSLDLHGFGWYSKDCKWQTHMDINDIELDATLTSPFLCQNCSRSKNKAKKEHIENLYLQKGLF